MALVSVGLPCDLCGSTPPHRVVLPSINGSPYSLVECAACGLRFIDPRPSLEARLERLAAASREPAERFVATGKWPDSPSTASPEGQWAHLRAFALAQFTRVQQFTGQQNPKVYEVGGWVGWLLNGMLALGAHERSGGCEPNGHAVAVALDSYGVRLEPVVFQGAAAVEQPYDAVVMNDVVEHSDTSCTDLKKAREITRLGGCLYLKTFLDELDPDRMMLKPEDHMTHFTESTLRRALQQARWSVQSWEVMPGWPHVTLFGRAEW